MICRQSSPSDAPVIIATRSEIPRKRGSRSRPSSSIHGVGTAADRKDRREYEPPPMDLRVRLNLLLTLLAVVVIAVAAGARGAGSDLPTRSVTLPGGATAYWLVHRSSTTQVVGDGNARDKHRVIRWGSGGLYADTRKTYAVFGFKLTTGAPGRMYDFHTQPDDVGGWNPPCSAYVAPLAIDYWGDSRGLIVVAQPEDTGCAGTPPAGYVQGSGNFHSRSSVERKRSAPGAVGMAVGRDHLGPPRCRDKRCRQGLGGWREQPTSCSLGHQHTLATREPGDVLGRRVSLEREPGHERRRDRGNPIRTLPAVRRLTTLRLSRRPSQRERLAGRRPR